MSKAALILQGAMQEFLARGYSAASMDRVAAAAGVSKATVYSHFGDKETLFKELVAQMAQKKMQSILSGNDASTGIDFGNYPTAKTYTVGLEVTF